jgi:hypothetical protein
MGAMASRFVRPLLRAAVGNDLVSTPAPATLEPVHSSLYLRICRRGLMHLVSVTVILLLFALVGLVVLAILWRQHPTKFRLTLKLWRLVHLELESESVAPKMTTKRS